MGEILTLVDEGLGNASYLVDLGDSRALVIDPVRDPRPYLAAARHRALRVALTADTHLHNDFVSGSRELAALGATVLGPAGDGVGFPHRTFREGEDIDLGGLALRALETPGHTPEHVSFLLLDDSHPVAVFTGGALLRGSVARTDLMGAELAEPLARDLYRSVRERLFSLPNDLPVYPTHGAGPTFCTTVPAASDGVATTIGHEKVANKLLSLSDEDSFVRRLVSTYSTYPRYFARLRDLNQKGPRVYGEAGTPLPALPVDEFRRRYEEGAELIDARPVGKFAGGHVLGALSIELRPAFATWLGWLVPHDRPLLFVLSGGQHRADLVWQCLKIGHENLVGELSGGMEAWREAGLPERTLPLIPPSEAGHATFLDVRQRGEFRVGHIPDAVHVELGSLEAEARTLPTDPLTVHCGHAERAMTAASLLEQLGRRDVAVLLGGPRDWSAAWDRPLARGEP